MIREPEDIAALPWAGNFADDRELFLAVEAYIFIEPDPVKRRRADELANWYGCGEKVRCPLDYDPRR
jgi:hypothetical protein